MKIPFLYTLAALGTCFSHALGSGLDEAPVDYSCTRSTTITITSTITTSIGCSESLTTTPSTISTSTRCTDGDTTLTSYTAPAPTTCTDATITITSVGETPGTTTKLPTTTCEPVTIIVTETPTPLSCPTRPDCPPLGLNVDYYSNQFGYNGYTSPTAGQTEEEVFPPSYYVTEGLIPIESSLTNVTYIAQDYHDDLNGYPLLYPDANNPQVPYYVGYKREVNGGIEVDGNNYTLVYSGFYRAPTSGNYSICASADNVDYSYLGGGIAFDCLSGKPDTDAKPLTGASAGSFYNNPVSCGYVNLVAGEFYPIRSVMGNGDAVSAFNLTIQAPGEDNKNDNAGHLYPVKCRL
ncbi:hypothetical protein FQN54_009994 [Arachnomyces sp. PD_36]|nr:hypothetical protein FQN54_009994 [Arachnomyces sp. PD_36]